MDTLSTNIKTLRLKRNLTQGDLADLCNVSVASISAYETGMKTPGVDILVRIAKALRTTSSVLLGETK